MDNSNVGRRQQINFLIYPKFQITLLVINSLILFLAFGIGGMQFLRSFEKLKGLGVQAGFSADHPYFNFISMQLEFLLKYQAITMIMALLISSILTLLVSHKLAGPIARLRDHFKGVVQEGKWHPVGFRQQDYFQELPRFINQALEKILRK